MAKSKPFEERLQDVMVRYQMIPCHDAQEEKVRRRIINGVSKEANVDADSLRIKQSPLGMVPFLYDSLPRHKMVPEDHWEQLVGSSPQPIYLAFEAVPFATKVYIVSPLDLRELLTELRDLRADHYLLPQQRSDHWCYAWSHEDYAYAFEV